MEVGHGTAPPGLQEGQGHIAAPHTAWAGTWARRTLCPGPSLAALCPRADPTGPLPTTTSTAPVGKPRPTESTDLPLEKDTGMGQPSQAKAQLPGCPAGPDTPSPQRTTPGGTLTVTQRERGTPTRAWLASGCPSNWDRSPGSPEA